jgi:hypothetical protein
MLDDGAIMRVEHNQTIFSTTTFSEVNFHLLLCRMEMVRFLDWKFPTAEVSLRQSIAHVPVLAALRLMQHSPVDVVE